MQKISKKPELVVPCGDIEKLQIAFKYGADGVYLGGKNFNLRAKSGNFDNDELQLAVQITRKLNKKIYITLNSLIYNKDISEVIEFVKYLNTINPDAVIISDMGMLNILKEYSDLPIHISTQTSTLNYKAVEMWKYLGVQRVILAREISIKDMKLIKENVPDIELEVFVHGAMCMAYSGRCNLSSYLTGRLSNQGLCTHSCRWKYYLMEEKRPHQYFPVFEDETGSYIYSSKDLCTIEFIDQLIDTGVDAFKIEGRMKGILYCATTTKIYKEAIDSYFSNENFKYNPQWKVELLKFTNRGYTSGFYLGGLDPNFQRLDDVGYDKNYELAAKVIQKIDEHIYLIEVRNQIKVPVSVEIVKPYGDIIEFTLNHVINAKTDMEMSEANPGSLLKVYLPFDLEEWTLIRQKVNY